MSHTNYRGKIRDKATSTQKLETRLRKNEQYSKGNFNEWLLTHLDARPGMHILDVGCGTGAQTIPIAEAVGGDGSVSALDLSQESIDTLLADNKAPNVEAVATDMMKIGEVITDKFSQKSFDLALSTYALYYADDPIFVMDAMRGSLKDGGRLAIATPDTPHGMVDFCAAYGPIPGEVLESASFGRQTVEPYFRKNFADVALKTFNNILKLPDVESFTDLYRATTYYNKDAEPYIREAVERIIGENGCFEFAKNTRLMIGRHPDS